MDLEISLSKPSVPQRFGTRLHKHLRYTKTSDTGAPVDVFAARSSARLQVQKLLDCSLHSVVGTGLGPDSAQMKRGILGPVADTLSETTRGVLRVGGDVAATVVGVVASCTVGAHRRSQGDVEPQTTEHWVSWSKSHTSNWTEKADGWSSEGILVAVEALKSVTAILGGVILGLAWVYDRCADALKPQQRLPVANADRGRREALCADATVAQQHLPAANADRDCREAGRQLPAATPAHELPAATQQSEAEAVAQQPSTTAAPDLPSAAPQQPAATAAPDTPTSTTAAQPWASAPRPWPLPSDLQKQGGERAVGLRA